MSLIQSMFWGFLKCGPLHNHVDKLKWKMDFMAHKSNLY